MNAQTVQVESWLGAVYISLWGIFCVGLIFVSLENFNSDLLVLDSQNVRLKTISNSERYLINSWLEDNQIEVPQGKGYRYVVNQYPSRPWFK